MNFKLDSSLNIIILYHLQKKLRLYFRSFWKVLPSGYAFKKKEHSVYGFEDLKRAQIN